MTFSCLYIFQAGNTVLHQCRALVDQLGLFSTNEDADDIATAGRGCEAQPYASDTMSGRKQGWFAHVQI